MKPISLTKTMPWLLGASAVFTLAFSQNVSANTNGNQQATSIKQIQNTKVNQVNPDQMTSRMAYLDNGAIKAIHRIGDSNVLLPTSDGLDNFHAEINANFINLQENNPPSSDSPYTQYYQIHYSLGKPKPFNDSSLDRYKNAYDQFNVSEFKNLSDAEKSVGYSSPSTQQNAPQVDLGNGITAYKHTETVVPGQRYDNYLVFYLGPWQVTTATFVSESESDASAFDSAINEAKNEIPLIQQANLPKTDSHGYIGLGDVSQINWQIGNKSYSSKTYADANQPSSNGYKVNATKTNLKMVGSIENFE